MYRTGYAAALRPSCREAGAALFISLVFLFTLTVIGLAGMQNTVLQEKMAGNLRDRSLAFQAADSALRVAEAWLTNTATLAFDCSSENDGLYKNTQPGEAAYDATKPDAASNCPTEKGWPSSSQTSHAYSVENDKFWNDGDTPNTDVVTVNDAQFNGLAEKPKYVIEQMNITSNSLEAGKALQTEMSFYRVTAHGVGVTSGAVVILQSVYYPPR